MKIIRAVEFGHDAKLKISKIFVDGLYQWLRFFSKDKNKLQKAFTHMFNLDVFYVAVIDGGIAGMAACTDGKAASVHLQRKELKKHLGFLMGTITYYILKNQFEQKPYPFEIERGVGAVEFVATSNEFRGQGVATAMMKHIIDSSPYDEYVLEVADTNTIAVRLYEKLGYKEFLRIKHKHSKRSGVDYLVYMKYSKKTQ